MRLQSRQLLGGAAIQGHEFVDLGAAEAPLRGQPVEPIPRPPLRERIGIDVHRLLLCSCRPPPRRLVRTRPIRDTGAIMADFTTGEAVSLQLPIARIPTRAAAFA